MSPAALAALWALIRADLRRLFRTEQIHRYALLPGLLFVPVVVMAGTLVASLQDSEGVVAVPPGLPWELQLAEQLDDYDLTVEEHADPMAAFEAGRVDAAVVVEAREGIERARGGLELADRAAWVVHVAAVERGVEWRIEAAIDDAAWEAMQTRLVLAGGHPETDLRILDIETVAFPDADDGFDLDAGRGLRAYLCFLVGALAFMFLTLPGVADRQAGITESLRVLPVPPWTLVASRVLSFVVVQVLTVVLLVANVLLLLAHVDADLSAAVPPPQSLLGFAGVMVFGNALYAAVGTWAPNAKAANNGAGIAMFALIGLLVWGVLGEPPAAVPVAGAITAETLLGQAVAGLSSLLAAAVVIGLTGRALARRVDLVLPAGGEA